MVRFSYIRRSCGHVGKHNAPASEPEREAYVRNTESTPCIICEIAVERGLDSLEVYTVPRIPKIGKIPAHGIILQLSKRI